jgi:hypothetical protein
MKRKPLNPSLPAPYNKMTAEEMDAEVQKFDHPATEMRGKPLSRTQRAQHRRARKKMGRPVIGKGSMRLTITMEKGLVSKTDLLAKKKNLSRSQLIAKGLEVLLKAS